jgi:hypothetical protein
MLIAAQAKKLFFAHCFANLRFTSTGNASGQEVFGYSSMGGVKHIDRVSNADHRLWRRRRWWRAIGLSTTTNNASKCAGCAWLCAVRCHVAHAYTHADTYRIASADCRCERLHGAGLGANGCGHIIHIARWHLGHQHRGASARSSCS